MSVHKDQCRLKQGSEVGRRQQLLILAHQGKGFKAGLRGLWMQGCHVDQGTYSLPATSAPEHAAQQVRR